MILSKITIGSILLLEVDADPSNVLNPTPAPVGSEAYFNDAGVGKTYLKFGAGDNDWTAYQTGSEPSDWKFTTDANQLNVAIAKSYFGTKAGSDFDIQFNRNGVGVFEFRTGALYMLAQDIRKETGDLRVLALAGTLHLISNQSMNIMAETEIASTYVSKLDAMKESGNIRAYEKVLSVGASPVDGDATSAKIIASTLVSKNRIAKFFISLTSTGGAVAVFEKTVHVDHNNTLILMQDDFTSKNALGEVVSASIAYSAGNYTVTLSGLAGLAGKQFRIKFDEIVMF